MDSELIGSMSVLSIVYSAQDFKYFELFGRSGYIANFLIDDYFKTRTKQEIIVYTTTNGLK